MLGSLQARTLGRESRSFGHVCVLLHTWLIAPFPPQTTDPGLWKGSWVTWPLECLSHRCVEFADSRRENGKLRTGVRQQPTPSLSPCHSGPVSPYTEEGGGSG